MTQTKRKKKNIRKHRKTRRRNNVPKDIQLLSDSVKQVINDKLYKHYRNRVINDPSLKNLQGLEIVFEHSVKKDLTKKKSYTPSINKKLVSIKSVKNHPLFTCDSLSPLEKTVSTGKLRVQVPHNGSLVCTNIYSSLAKDIFLQELKNNKIYCKSLIPPIQYHTNCWFNTFFMCVFISDKGRKFFRFLRQAMIEGKLINGNPIQPQSLKNALILFNAAIEAVQNKNNHLSNSSLALNTNSIIHNIYKAIPKTYHEGHYGIKDVDEYGNPLAFYTDLIDFIDAKSSGIPSMKILSGSSEVSSFLSGSDNESSDIVIVQLYNSEYTPSYAQSNRFKKGTIIKHENNEYKLDSAVIRDNSHTHFACAITCNGRQMLYDGAAFNPLISRKWKNMLNRNSNFKLPGSKNQWNFKKGYQILFYYRTNSSP